MNAEYSIHVDEFKEELTDDTRIEFVFAVRDHAMKHHLNGVFATWFEEEGNKYFFQVGEAEDRVQMEIVVELDSDNEYVAHVDIYSY